MSNTFGAPRKYDPLESDVLLFGAIPFLKNFKIYLIFCASFSLLGVILNWNPKLLNFGPWNSNSRFGLIAVPVILERNASGLMLIPNF